MPRHLANIYRLGVKELWSLLRDPVMLVLIVYTFTASVYTAATAMPETLHNAAIAVVDEDASNLSGRIISAFYPPQFGTPQLISPEEMDAGMDSGRYTFVLRIPPALPGRARSARASSLHLTADATRISQAFTGSGYVQQIVQGEINEFTQRYRTTTVLPVELSLRARFNPGPNKP